MSDLATLISLDRHEDHRGSFTEVFRENWLPRWWTHNVEGPLWQEGHTQASICVSRRGALRGMHKHATHGDFWSLASGRIQVGLYRDGKSEAFTLGPESAVYIPPRTWHGFLALENTTLVYIQDAYYDPADEFVARWDSCGIKWYLPHLPILSDRDRTAPPLKEAEREVLR